jgi:hypothetical protein
MEVLHTHSADLDVHKDSVVVCVHHMVSTSMDSSRLFQNDRRSWYKQRGVHTRQWRPHSTISNRSYLVVSPNVRMNHFSAGIDCRLQRNHTQK